MNIRKVDFKLGIPLTLAFSLLFGVYPAIEQWIDLPFDSQLSTIAKADTPYQESNPIPGSLSERKPMHMRDFGDLRSTCNYFDPQTQTHSSVLLMHISDNFLQHNLSTAAAKLVDWLSSLFDI
jgi:hypothetical protein